MEKKVTGSWLIHHTNKLQGISNQVGYEKTYFAGKAGILLSAISADQNITINDERLKVLATASNINTLTELPTLIDVLSKQELIDKSSKGISVLGVTPRVVLQHTADIFESLEPQDHELASIELSERASIAPVLVNEIGEEISDTYKLKSSDLNQFFKDAETIGFVDAENIGDDQTVLFNGNLFRRDNTKKIMAVLQSLKPEEQRNLTEVTGLLQKSACIDVPTVRAILGDTLFEKATAIGIFDISIVSNSKEEVGYMTLPSAFSKYSNSMVDDAFDLAKAFISSLTYGMTKSHHERGQITMIELLLRELVQGEPVGPVKAIAEDYKILELKGVVKVEYGYKKGRYGPLLKLLKKEVGELALQAIRQGDVSEHSLTEMPTAVVTTFKGPENNRERIRRKQSISNPKITNDMISSLRTGGKL